MRPSRLPYVLVPGLIALAALFVSFACGGGRTPEGADDPQPLCYYSSPLPDGGAVRPIRPNEWGALALRGYNAQAQRGSAQRATQNCRGDEIRYVGPDRNRCEIHDPEDEPAPEAVDITEESIIVGRGSGPMVKPVWVITHRFENGDGFGPIILTQRRELGVAVQAIGTLRLPTERARLRLREAGGQRLIVADGERCPPPEEEGEGDDAPPANAGGDEEEEEEEEPTCLRATRILPVVGNEILNPEVMGPRRPRTAQEAQAIRERARRGDQPTRDDWSCIGPSLIYTEREAVIGLENGWERVFTLHASMEYDTSGAIIIHEQVVMVDRDPRDPGRPPLNFRTTDHDRYYFVHRGAIRSRGTPLLERAIRAHGSIQHPIAQGGGNNRESGSGQGGAQN